MGKQLEAYDTGPKAQRLVAEFARLSISHRIMKSKKLPSYAIISAINIIAHQETNLQQSEKLSW